MGRGEAGETRRLQPHEQFGNGEGNSLEKPRSAGVWPQPSRTFFFAGSRHEQRARCPLRLLPWVEPTVQLGDPGSEASALSPRSHRLPAPRRRKPRGKRRPRCQPCRGRKEEGDGREVSERRQQRYLLPSWGGTLPPGRKRSSALLGVVFHGWEVPNNSRKTLSRVCSASRCRRDRNFGISAKSLLSVLSKMTK